MENLEKLEAKMVRDIDEYVRAMDEFETALNTRRTAWNDRAKLARKLAAARNKTLNLIVSGGIAGGAIFLIMTMLVM
ncbi:MAG: hypothetical protein IKU34_00490 [Clostridia bacterium]|nr:hypothetical protein [Clostridia bacterium]